VSKIDPRTHFYGVALVTKENTKILVVEDDESISILIKQVLELDDYSVDSVTNGAEALDYLKTQVHPKLILSDLTMPVMDGIEFRKKQLKNLKIAHIPFLLMTADTQFSMKEVGLTSENFLKKPLSIDEVLQKVRVALQRKLK
jgi:CheY-like chemotaxis protein